MKRLELVAYAGAIAALSVALIAEGRTTTALLAQAELSPRELYALLGNRNVKVQIVDLRPVDDDNFLDAHIPGAIPVPGCELEALPAAVRERVYPYVQTVVVTAEGDRQAFEKCRAHFGAARNLAGGFTAWSAANLPEDTGEYSPPRASAGGGCL